MGRCDGAVGVRALSEKSQVSNSIYLLRGLEGYFELTVTEAIKPHRTRTGGSRFFNGKGIVAFKL